MQQAKHSSLNFGLWNGMVVLCDSYTKKQFHRSAYEKYVYKISRESFIQYNSRISSTRKWGCYKTEKEKGDQNSSQRAEGSKKKMNQKGNNRKYKRWKKQNEEEQEEKKHQSKSTLLLAH